MRRVNQAIDARDEAALLAALGLPALGLVGISAAHAHWYLEHLTSHREHRNQVAGAYQNYIDSSCYKAVFSFFSPRAEDKR